jgi:mannose-6-phosphate isomerase-like protein (cupin superfamily)
MALKPGEDIGTETHFDGDQIFLVLSGAGEAALNRVNIPVRVNSLVAVPAGTEHNIRNTGPGMLRLVTVYAPPQHRPGTVHPTKADAAGERH